MYDPTTILILRKKRKGYHEMLVQKVEKICEDTAKLDGYNIKVRLQQGMDLVLGEMSSDSRYLILLM